MYLCGVSYVYRAHVKLKTAKREEKKKIVGFELFGLILNPSISQAEVSSSPCGPPVFLPLGLRLELNLVQLSDEDFAMIPKAEETRGRGS